MYILDPEPLAEGRALFKPRIWIRQLFPDPQLTDYRLRCSFVRIIWTVVHMLKPEPHKGEKRLRLGNTDEQLLLTGCQPGLCAVCRLKAFCSYLNLEPQKGEGRLRYSNTDEQRLPTDRTPVVRQMCPIWPYVHILMPEPHRGERRLRLCNSDE